ncbi:hypothetical protein Btru_051633 [Bulinus truncatus]|nr:hypothetical protein Btru_051633 [Bulinus truncatus]
MPEKKSDFDVQNDRLMDDLVSQASSASRYDPERQITSQVKRYQKVVLSLVVISTVLCLMVLAIGLFTIYQNNDSRLKHTVNSKPIACVDCNKLVRNPYDLSAADSLLDSLTHDYVDGVEKCCAYDSGALSVLLELTMRRQEVNKAPVPSFNVSDFTFSPASAHMRMYPPHKPFTDVEYRYRVPTFSNGSVYVLFQRENSTINPLTEHFRGVEVLKDGLRIVYDGLYYVYSSVHFRPESAHPCKDFKYQTWTHYIERLSPNNPAQTGCLLRTSHTCCDECSMDEETSYTGGTFYLTAGDVIRVAIDGYGLVYFRQQSSFAGLMMLGTGSSDSSSKL